MPTCDKCHRPADVLDLEMVEVLMARATMSSPAEYDEQSWCGACREREAYLSDPWNVAYERARANGWAD